VKQKWRWLPPWNMPADPVRAVFWFMRWLLQVLVRYFYILVLVGVVYETYLNGIVGLAGTLLVGLLIWAGLAVLLVVINITSGVSRVYSEMSRLGRNSAGFSYVAPEPEKEENVVEGSIIMDLEEERKRRRQEM
jgi:hypothetical protein